jgi:aryl-alcohol dehydrogenase-like predicted oxidoreductase
MSIEHRPFGGTGIRVSRFCLGAMMFGAMGNRDEAECVRIVHAALDAGVNFVDTADAYSAGESERIVGKALAGRRDRVVLATKCFFPTGRDVNEGGGSRRWIVRAVEESLRRLGTDWIDVYQLHRRDFAADLEESLAAMHTLREQGKIRVVGMSATPAETIVEAQWISERRALARVRSEQCIYSIFARGVEAAVLPTCRRYGLGVMVYAPLGGGWLAGKYRRGVEPEPGSRSQGFFARTGRWDPARPEVQRKYDLVEALAALAAEAGVPLAHLAMGFATEHPAVSSAIVGPRTLAQAEELLGGLEVRLAPEVLDRIDALVAPGADLDARDTTASNPALEQLGERRRAAHAAPPSGR